MAKKEKNAEEKMRKLTLPKSRNSKQRKIEITIVILSTKIYKMNYKYCKSK